MAVATIVILSVLLSIHLLPSKVSLQVGDVSRETIIARGSAGYIDTAETELRRRQALESVGKAYDPVSNASDQAIGALKTMFHAIEDVRASSANASASKKVQLVRERLGLYLGTRVTDSALTVMLTVDSPALREIEDDALRIVSTVMSGEIRDSKEHLEAARQTAARDAERLIKDRAKSNVLSQVTQDAIRPNRVFSEERTRSLQEAAQRTVPPAHRQINPGEIVIASGETVLQEHIDKFEALGLRHPRVDYRSVVGMSLFVVLAVVLVSAFLHTYHPEVYANTKMLLLLALIVGIGTFALRMSGSMLGLQLTVDQVGYLGVLWVTTAAMLLCALINPHVAVVVSALLSVVLSLMVNQELRYAATALFSALVGIYSVAYIRGRNDFMRAGGLLALTGTSLTWTLGGIAGAQVSHMLYGSAWSVLVAASSVWLFWFGTWLLERPFDKTTHISLLELADTDKPLLRRLVMEAPGTYTHSVAVAYLAEAAAEAVGADALVAKVSSFYHDIGKIRRPHFFIENQHVENAHDSINPTLSALVITSHIKDGVDIAREARLPRAVIDVICQHHGTSLVQYFYSQVYGTQEPNAALEQQFRYSGPKPKSKEASIVMLADSVEAASRSLQKPTRAAIELMVEKVIADKIADEQLDECELTFSDVSTIVQVFTRALVSNMHARIEYPDIPGAESKGNITDADTDNQPPEDTSETDEDQEAGEAVAQGGELR